MDSTPSVVRVKFPLSQFLSQKDAPWHGIETPFCHCLFMVERNCFKRGRPVKCASNAAVHASLHNAPALSEAGRTGVGFME